MLLPPISLNKTVLIAYDLIELDGEDLRRTPIEQRKRTLFAIPIRPLATLAQGQKSECASGKTRGGGGLRQIKLCGGHIKIGATRN
jgi:hypothetical protein